MIDFLVTLIEMVLVLGGMVLFYLAVYVLLKKD